MIDYVCLPYIARSRTGISAGISIILYQVYSLALWIAPFLNEGAHKFKMGDIIICKSFHFPRNGPKALFSRKIVTTGSFMEWLDKI